MGRSAMTPRGLISPTDKAIRKYYEDLHALRDQRVLHEMGLRSPFQRLLEDTARLKKWTLIAELSEKTSGGRVQPDGTLRDGNSLPRGYWEAKDTQDDLDLEIKKKTAKGYKLSNTIFEDTEKGVLYQNRQEVLRVELGDPEELAKLLNQFYSYTEPDIEGFEEAVGEFKERVPELARGLVEKIREAHRDNRRFQAAFDQFFALCKTALNPNIRAEAVDEMLVQHLLTERLFRTIFNNPDFVKKNAIAAEVEEVIAALVSKSFDRMEFLKSLDRFYVAIESAARTLPDFSEKQHFLNIVYERFFQGYSVKVADTMGIVYTPQEIVNFMCASVAEVLESEFGKSLSSKDIYIIDPCTGTGNFVVNLLRRMPKRDLPRMYKDQLFANEVMLLPYYIAALNIEHAYYEMTGEYEPFEGLCFVDTLDLAEGSQSKLGFMTETNTRRVERQKSAPITVVIGNPPYNMNQQNENDNNKNRKYPVIDRRVAETYGKSSKASNRGALADPYVKFFRWAADRLQGRDGIVCLVSNNKFAKGIATDGFRNSLRDEFNCVYHLDLKGDARTTGERRRREAGNVFGDQIRVGVGITVLVRKSHDGLKNVHYYAAADYLKAPEKANELASFGSIYRVSWEFVTDGRYGWHTATAPKEFDNFPAIGSRESKRGHGVTTQSIFRTYSRGIETCRDEWTYDFHAPLLETKVKELAENYNAEIDRWRRAGKPPEIDNFVMYDPKRIKWCSRLKDAFKRELAASYSAAKIRNALYRPFVKKYVYIDSILTHRRGILPEVFPAPGAESENRLIVVSDIGSRSTTFSTLVTGSFPDLHLCAPVDSHQCFPFHIYDEDGSNRRENITNWALERFRERYGDKKISKWDVFHYVYGVLHHPEYREKYAENLKRELPRIPLAKDFRGFAEAGRELARLHVEYEAVEPWPLQFIETTGGPKSKRTGQNPHVQARVGHPHPQVGPLADARPSAPLGTGGSDNKPFTYRVIDKMRLAKDKKSLKVNDTLTLGGIPAEAFEYRLGNRSALEWVIDQYQVTEDKRSGIRQDPNRADDPEYIVRLVGQVVRVSVETVRIVKGLPGLGE